MSAARRHRLISLGLLLLAGCCSSPVPKAPRFGELLPVEPRPLEPTFAAEPASSPSSPPATACYRGLTPAEAQCRAVHGSSLGNLLLAQQRTRDPLEGPDWLTGLCASSRSLHRKIVADAANDARNRSAGDALEAYYQLAEAEGRAQLLRLSLAEVDQTLRRIQELIDKGVRPAAEANPIRRQRNELHADAVQLQLSIEQLNVRLKVLLGLGCAADEFRLWPLTDLAVVADDTDLCEVVRIGLERRPDLVLLRRLLRDLNFQTLAVVKQMLGGINVLLSGPPMPQPTVANAFGSVMVRLVGGGVDKYRRQLRSLLAEREQQAASEIRLAVKQVELHFQLTELARQRVELAGRKVAEEEEKKEKGMGSEADLTRARLDLFKARGELLHTVAGWEIARARLRQAQGLLVVDCLEAKTARAQPSGAEGDD